MTPPKDKLLELAERCEAAAGPDDALDWSIAEAIGCAPGLPYSASLDAAMTLVPEGWDVRMGSNSGAPWAQCKRTRPLVDCHNGAATTLPLAICAAALRSRSQTTEPGEG
jgi:hypothetical protein